MNPGNTDKKDPGLKPHASYRWSTGPVVCLIEDGQYLSFSIYGWWYLSNCTLTLMTGEEDRRTKRPEREKKKGGKFGNQTGIIKRAEGKGWKWMICIKRYHTVFRLRHCLVPLCCNEEPQSDNLWSERVTLERFSWGPQDQTSPSAKWAAEWATAWFIS